MSLQKNVLQDNCTEYEFLEFDMVHAKDYFDNYKFGLIERISKMYFLKNLVEDNPFDNVEVLQKSKSQLKDIKDIGRKYEEDILKLSTDICNITKKIENERLELAKMEELKEKSIEEIGSVQKMASKYEDYLELSSKYNKIYEEVGFMSRKIENLKGEYSKIDIDEVEKQIFISKEYRSKLEGKKKRLSMVQYEKYIEDLFYMYCNFKSFLYKIFPIDIENRLDGDKIILNCKCKYDVHIVVENGILSKVAISNSNPELEEAVRYYKFKNNLRYLILFLLFSE